MQFNRERWAALAGFILLAAWLLFFASEGLTAFFTDDDVMNLQALHGLWDKPIWRIALGVLNPFSGEYRPVGGLFYRTFWNWFGFDPMPYRIGCFALLLAGLGLAYLLVRRHIESWPAVMAGMLMCVYQAEMTDLYFNSGTVYDLLANIFFLTILLCAGNAPAWQIGLLTWLAVQSKEMAATVPAILFLYYWLVLKKVRLSPVLASGLAAALVMAAKLSRDLGLTANVLYQPRFDPVFVLEQYAKYHGDLLGLNEPMNFGWMLTSWFLLALVASTLRDRRLWFGLGFWLVTLLPVTVIPARSAFVLQLPLIGLALCGAALVSKLPRPYLQYAALAVLALLMVPYHLSNREFHYADQRLRSNAVRAMTVQLKQQVPSPPSGSRLYFLDDPYPLQNEWTLTLMVRLLYGNPAILVDRAKAGAEFEANTKSYVIDYRSDGLQVKRHTAVLEPSSIVEPSRSPVEVRFDPAAAHPGEPYKVIVRNIRSSVVDVEYSTVQNGIEQVGRVKEWCALDDQGHARLTVPPGMSPGTIKLTAIRVSGGPWRRAEGSLTILP